MTSMEEAASQSKDKLDSAMRRLSDASSPDVPEEDSARTCVGPCVRVGVVVAASHSVCLSGT